jgi:hypothetical protein
VPLLLTVLVTLGGLFVIHCMGVVNLFNVVGRGIGSRTFAEGTDATLDGSGREELESEEEERSFIR